MDKKKNHHISRKQALKNLGCLAMVFPFQNTFLNYFNGATANENSTIIADGAALFPFQLSHNAPDNVTNFKHLLDAPAGKHGFIYVKNGRFVTKKGTIRFNGTNLTGSANFPSAKDADKLADRLAGLGINCVRIHYIDADYGNFLQEPEQGLIASNTKTQCNFDARQLDKLDYLIAELKKRGIYVNINLHVARWWDERDGFRAKEQRPKFDKGLDNFEPRMIELQKEYARKLLTHVNPYTKLAYTDEPAVALIEINNENSLFNQYFKGSIDKLPEPYATEFRKQWNNWLIKKYKTTEEVKKAWTAVGENIQSLLENEASIAYYSVPVVKLKQDVPLQTKKDFYQFIADTEENYWVGMYKFLKNELKVKSPISGTQLTSWGMPFVQAQLDYIDNHAYWGHPGPIGKNWKIENKAMVNSMNTVFAMASPRINGKPYTISEYNHPFPNQYGAEGLPIIMSYGSLNGWDGIFQYSFHHRNNFQPSYNNYFFSISDRVEVLAHFRACSSIFLRNDVAEAKTECIGALNYDAYTNSMVKNNHLRAGIDFCGLDKHNVLVHKSSVKLGGAQNIQPKDNSLISNQKILVSDTGELIWNTEDKKAGYFVADTANTKIFTGFPKGRSISLGKIKLAIGQTRLGWATISMVSKNGNGFGEDGQPANILLAATGLTENKGMAIVNYPDEKIALSNWGGAPIYVEGISATLTFPVNPNQLKCYALDTKGNRMQTVEIIEKDNLAQLNISAQYKTVWYEIIINKHNAT